MADLLDELRTNDLAEALLHYDEQRERAAKEIECLRKLVLVGDVRCEQCAAPATTLDMGEFASCVDCAANAKEPSDG